MRQVTTLQQSHRHFKVITNQHAMNSILTWSANYKRFGTDVLWFI